jgi:dihydrofolate reductase
MPADLAHFKRLTLDKPIIMGRKTWESLPGLLPRRRHIVVTRDSGYGADGADIVHSPEQAIALAGTDGEIMLVGGAGLYARMLPMVARMYLTYVHADVQGDAWFPAFDTREWRETRRERHPADERNPHDYSFVELARV